MLVFESLDIRILHHYGTVELLFIQTSLEKECRIRSLSEHKCLPVIAIIKMKRITTPNGFKKPPKYGIVHIKCLKFPFETTNKSWVCETLNPSLPITAPRCHFPFDVTFTLLSMNISTVLLQCCAVLSQSNMVWMVWGSSQRKAHVVVLYPNVLWSKIICFNKFA